MTTIEIPILADAGIPMIFVQWPLMLCALIPVILIEALLIRRWVPLSYGDAFKGTGIANVVSTVAGIPLTWVALLLIELAILLPLSQFDPDPSLTVDFLIFPLGAAWLGPVRAYWIVSAAATILLIPFFFASVWIEYWCCCFIWKKMDRTIIWRGVFRANVASYLLLFLMGCGWTFFNYWTRKTLYPFAP